MHHPFPSPPAGVAPAPRRGVRRPGGVWVGAVWAAVASAAALAAAVAGVGAVPVGASPAALAETVPAAVGGVLPELAAVPVASPAVEAADARVQANRSARNAADAAAADARTRAASADDELVELEAEEIRLEAARRSAQLDAALATDRAAGHRADLAAARSLLEEVAVAAFVGAGQVESFTASLTSPDGVPEGPRRGRYAAEVLATALQRREAALDALAEARGQAAEAEALDRRWRAELAGNAESMLRNRRDAERARAEEADALEAAARFDEQLPSLLEALSAARRTAPVRGLDLPLVVLDAFVRAERWTAWHRPGCRLPWTLLAGISRIESGHGTFGGATVDGRGQTSPGIVGPRLDGSSGFASIPDTDGGALDGDPVYDRAVGPMQFIPSSWAIFGMDGNGDGVADPRNYYDAALAAAEHLCRPGHDVGTAEGRHRALLGYNQSEVYVASVLAAEARYVGFRIGFGW